MNIRMFSFFSVLIVLLFPTTSFSWTRYPIGDDPFTWMSSSIPLQAAVCDIAGIGIVSANDGTGVVVSVSTYWLGNPGSNTLYITRADVLPPSGTDPIVFFASRYMSFLELAPPESHYTYIFDMDYHRQRFSPDGLFFNYGKRSWFPAVSSNENLTAFASNLVYVAQVNTNQMAFYEIIRDGYRTNSPTSRIYRDSFSTFQESGAWMSTNFMEQIWADPLLTGKIRDWVNNNYEKATGRWLSE